jgi:bifunctional oligoribonuclease and PAP phosphatase NrnA
MKSSYPEAEQVRQIINDAHKIVIVQADNPDSDSLASALALEEILSEMDKEVFLYCSVNLPSYLHHLEGWDRVNTELPAGFDASIIVDTSSRKLLARLEESGQKSWLATKPLIVIDHHSTEPTIDFANVLCIHPGVATAEVIYELSLSLDWPLNLQARKFLAIAILSDSLGLTSQSTTARSVHIIAELVEGGVNLAEIENARRQTMRRETELIHYKGRLLQRVEFHDNERIATITIPWEEIETYSPLYNPPMLVIDDMRLGRNTQVAIAFKLYPEGKITAKIRCNYGYAIADKLAESFGGGGHPYAAGFKITDVRNYEEIKSETIKKAAKLLDEAKTP